MRSLWTIVLSECPPHSGEANDSERNVQPELQTPIEEAHEHGAVERAPHPAKSFDRTECPECARPLCFGVHVADNGKRDWNHCATAEGREYAADEERAERGRQGDPDRADHEDHVGNDEGASATQHVADAPGDWHDRDECDEVGIDHPGCVVKPIGQDKTEVADDRAQHRRDNGEVISSHEHAEPDRPQNGPRGRSDCCRRVARCRGAES